MAQALYSGNATTEWQATGCSHTCQTDSVVLTVKSHSASNTTKLTPFIAKGVRFKPCRLCKIQTAYHTLLYIHSTSDLGRKTCSHPLVLSVKIN